MSTEENYRSRLRGRQVCLRRLCAWHGRLAPHDRQQRCQFPQSRVIDVAREIDHLVEWQPVVDPAPAIELRRSEEHTSELQSLMRNSYAVFCLKKNNKTKNRIIQ